MPFTRHSEAGKFQSGSFSFIVHSFCFIFKCNKLGCYAETVVAMKVDEKMLFLFLICRAAGHMGSAILSAVCFIDGSPQFSVTFVLFFLFPNIMVLFIKIMYRNS